MWPELNQTIIIQIPSRQIKQMSEFAGAQAIKDMLDKQKRLQKGETVPEDDKNWKKQEP